MLIVPQFSHWSYYVRGDIHMYNQITFQNNCSTLFGNITAQSSSHKNLRKPIPGGEKYN